MLSNKKVPGLLLIALFILAACAAADQDSSTAVVATASSPPSATAIKILPTPSLPGESVTWRNLQVRMEQAEITESFINEFNAQRVPSAGKEFLWVHVALENVGNDEVSLPEPENFSVLYAESEFKPIYGHRQGYVDYTTMDSTLFPGQKLDAWLRFDVSDTADLTDLWFIFLPSSAQVGVLPSSPNYPYAVDKPTYVWKCVP